MIISVIYLIMSFIFDGLMSSFFPSTLTSISYFTTIYIIIAFVIMYPYFDNDKKYYILFVIFGLLFDILYTSTFIFNMVLFFCIGLCVKMLHNVFPENVFTANIISIIGISLYHLLSFLILSIATTINYDFMLFVNIVTHSIFMTVIYTSISYFIMKFIYGRFDFKRIK